MRFQTTPGSSRLDHEGLRHSPAGGTRAAGGGGRRVDRLGAWSRQVTRSRRGAEKGVFIRRESGKRKSQKKADEKSRKRVSRSRIYRVLLLAKLQVCGV